MLKLPNNCRVGKMSVFPANWKTVRAKVNCTWRISYWIYDDNLQKRKQIVVKGMNDLHTLAEKQDDTKTILKVELHRLENLGYNPITDTFSAPIPDGEISEYTPFFDALNYTLKHLTCTPRTRKEIENHLKSLRKLAVTLQLDMVPIGQVKRRQIKILLEKAAVSSNHFNTYRKYLSLLFAQLKEYDCIESNIVRDLSKKSVIKKLRQTLTDEERAFVDKYLYHKDYRFWRLLQIFFHSGARETEMVKIRKPDVDLLNQTYKVTILKGESSREELKTIKNSVLHLWRELMELAGDDDYIFSRGLVPGPVAINPAQITKRWYRKIKKNKEVQDVHKITADFYSLKHLNSTEITDLLSDEDAAAMNSHTSTAMVVNIYDVKRKSRQHKRLKEVANKFA